MTLVAISSRSASWRVGKAAPVSANLRQHAALKGTTYEQIRHRNALRHGRTRTAAPAGKNLARAHPTTPDRGVAHEERLQACRGPQFQSAGRPTTELERS